MVVCLSDPLSEFSDKDLLACGIMFIGLVVDDFSHIPFKY